MVELLMLAATHAAIVAYAGVALGPKQLLGCFVEGEITSHLNACRTKYGDHRTKKELKSKLTQLYATR